MALVDAIAVSQPNMGTYLRGALQKIKDTARKYDRLIVVTDEQSHDGSLAAWTERAYMVNVAPYKHGLGYGDGWTHINGWSDRVVSYIRASESAPQD